MPTFWPFEKVLAEALQEHQTRLLGYCQMPNHWHLVFWPEKDDELTAFLRWLTHTHSMRWHAHYHTGGTGHIYQGRFNSFPVETDDQMDVALPADNHQSIAFARVALVGRQPSIEGLESRL